MEIIPLSEGAFTVDKTKQFIPFEKDKDDLQKRSIGSLLVEIQPFCIITRKDIIIIDTGLGFNTSSGSLQIHQNLMDKGINPMDVTKVLLSHLHKDHSGAIGKSDAIFNNKFFSFPNANYYVNKDELDFAFRNDGASYSKSDFEILAHSDKVVLTEGAGQIDNYISYEVSGAHSPYHQVFWIKEGDDIIFYGGDVAPQLQQMKNKFIAKYDYDGRKCMELRQEWWQKGETMKWTFLFYHDIKFPVYSFKV